MQDLKINVNMKNLKNQNTQNYAILIVSKLWKYRIIIEDGTDI